MIRNVFLGCAASNIPVLVDGFVSSVAALCAMRICPLANDYVFTSHVSKEPAGKMLLDELNLSYLLDCEMCLGEGTGAVIAFSIFDLAAEVYNKMCSFNEAKIEKYISLK